MNNLRQAAQAALEALLSIKRADTTVKQCSVIGELEAALAEPQPEPVTRDQIRDMVKECGIDWHRGFVPLFDGDDTNRYEVLVREVIDRYAAPQTQQTRYVKPWRKRLPRSPMNCSASEVVAAQQEEIAEWRDGHALQPLGYEQIVAIWSKHMKTRALPNYEDFARDIEAAHGIGVKNGPAGTSHVSSET